jgi:hypothetical protein
MKKLTIEEIKNRYIGLPQPSEPFIYKGIKINIPHICPFDNKIFYTSPQKIWTGHTKSCGCQKSRWIVEKKTTKNNTILTKQQEHILDGLLLGDGFIPNNRKINRNFSFHIGNINKELIINVQNKIPFSWGPIQIRKAEKIFRKDTNKFINCKKFYTLYSHVDKNITKYRLKWYPNDIKIVPKDLTMTPLTMLYWFYGDGSAGFTNNKNSIRIRFATNGFSLEDCELLINICKKQDINFILGVEHGYILAIYKKEDIEKFYQYIGNCTIKGFQYKWKKYEY